MFVNTVPLAARLTDGSTDDFISEVAAGLDRAVAHENYPFADIAAKWGYSVGVMYEYQRGVVDMPGIPMLRSVEGIGASQTKFGIAVRIIDRNGKAAIEIEYNDAAYSEKAVSEFMKSLVTAVDKLAAQGNGRLRRISLLDAEREALLDSFREREINPSFPADDLFHSGMERQAAASPDKTALIGALYVVGLKKVSEQRSVIFLRDAMKILQTKDF